jgi:hypothetical protein
MKKLAALVLLALECMVCGCGNSAKSTTLPTTSASGNWQAILVGGEGSAGAINFDTTFIVDPGGGTLNIDTVAFYTTSAGACFQSGQSASGSAVLVTSASNVVTGTMTLTVTSGVPAGNTLTLNGTSVTGTSNNLVLNDGVVTGTWTLTGGQGDPSCVSKSPGTFTMTQTAP